MKSSQPAHPGHYVRAEVFPKGLTVKKASEILGIGRPALSNFLNGKSGLSASLAIRMEKAFGADSKQLLKLQQDYDLHTKGTTNKDIAVRRLVPKYLSVKARDIERWAGRIEARSKLAALIRILIHSSFTEIVRIDFPAYDNAERRGWDGVLEVTSANPWIPSGSSGWEFGVSTNPEQKANSDYKARVEFVDAVERRNLTFVFVTPRNWPGKNSWAKEKQKLGEWKDVRVFDASDLEQWVEQSIYAQTWLAEELGISTDGLMTLENFWTSWSQVSEPTLVRALFSTSVQNNLQNFQQWLTSDCKGPFVITADSKEEGLAFVACLFSSLDDQYSRFADQAVIVNSADTLEKLVRGNFDFIPVVSDLNVEKILASNFRNRNCILVKTKNRPELHANIELRSLDFITFENALSEMGVEKNRIETLSRKTGNSITILRRLLARFESVRTPSWSLDGETASNLIPMVFAGTWDENCEADREILGLMSNSTYEKLARNFNSILPLEDSPLWSAGHLRGITSKIDALFAVQKYMTKLDLENFLFAAEYILSEQDPAIELPLDKRWAAGIYEKIRKHSNRLRQSICETLVILSVHGNDLFKKRLGVDLEIKIRNLIRKFLTPLSEKSLFHHDKELPNYAEAAPEEFLSIIENDLQLENSVIVGLMKSEPHGLFSTCSRVSILWALELIAWDPQFLARVCLCLCRLAEEKIDDNWTNKPINSLQSIFRWWMPQTASTIHQRIKCLELLVKNFPEIAWTICIEQIKWRNTHGHSNYRPNWREEFVSAGTFSPNEENYEFVRRALELCIRWKTHDEVTLADLIKILRQINDKKIELAVWDLVKVWNNGKATDETKAKLRENLRWLAFEKARSNSKNGKLSDSLFSQAKKIFFLLTPTSYVLKHAWLFHSPWIHGPFGDINGNSINSAENSNDVHELRRESIKEIWTHHASEGITQLISLSKSPYLVGEYTADCIALIPDLRKFLQDILQNESSLSGGKANEFVCGFLKSLDVGPRRQLLKEIIEEGSIELFEFLKLLPFNNETWEQIEEDLPNELAKYWKKIQPRWYGYRTDQEINKIIDSLLEAERPIAAFTAIQDQGWKRIDPLQLKRIMNGISTSKNEVGIFLDAHDIAMALQSLEHSGEISEDELALLEFFFMESLIDNDYKLPNLSKSLANSPSSFVRIVCAAFNKTEEVEDPVYLEMGDERQKHKITSACKALLRSLDIIPSMMDSNPDLYGERLQTWITEVRKLLKENGRQKIGDSIIGKLLSKAPFVKDQNWPGEEICIVIEDLHSTEISKGFRIGILNARGVHITTNGKEEIELATKYHALAETVRYEFPYVAQLLDSIAKSYLHEAEEQSIQGEQNLNLND